MKKVYSIINFKGGVCKTTLAVNIAAGLANYPQPNGIPLRVLLVDIDPQANASVYMLGEEYWRTNIQEKPRVSPNLYRLLLDKIKGRPIDYEFIIKPDTDGINPVFGDRKVLREDGKFEIKKAKQNWSNLHLLSSINNLFDLSKEIGYRTKLENNKHSLLDEILKMKYNEYDYIIIDCPTHFSELTQSAISASTDIIVPFIPDYLSTYGMNELFMRLSEYVDQNGKRDKLKVAVLIPTLFSDVSKDYLSFIEKAQEIVMKKRGSQTILKSTKIIKSGFKRTVNVAKLIEEHRPIIDLPSTNESRRKINFIIETLLNPKKIKRTNKV
ncbi:MAG: ParA family protein [Leptospiraceae bacterium]|nr:ParA family protein [Leptospiraceae bacterium]